MDKQYSKQVLKEFIERDRMLRENSVKSDYDKFCETTCRAIETILEENKELEEFKKQVTEIENTNFIKYKNYIPVSLVEEKIEELNKKEQELQDSISDEEREEYSDANISYQLMDIEVKRSVLQELLEKRK